VDLHRGDGETSLVLIPQVPADWWVAIRPCLNVGVNATSGCWRRWKSATASRGFEPVREWAHEEGSPSSASRQPSPRCPAPPEPRCTPRRAGGARGRERAEGRLLASDGEAARRSSCSALLADASDVSSASVVLRVEKPSTSQPEDGALAPRA
jgi:hypothetical protein